MISFIHTGDIHLGLKFENLSFPRLISSRRRMEIWTSFEGIVERANQEKVDFLFIAGDLFEEKYFTLGDIKRVKGIFKKARKVNIVISAGNHDTLSKNSLYRVVEWPRNVHIFPSNGLSKKEYRDKNVCVYGYSWDVAENKRDIFKDFPGLDRDKINILLVHGDLYNKSSKYLPLDRDYLSSLGFNYIALGHIHKPEIFSNKMAYSGSPEPLNFGEQGEHGIIQGQVSKEETRINFIPFSQRKFIEKNIRINEYMDFSTIVDTIRKCDIREKRLLNFYRLKLTGLLNRNINLDLEDLKNLLEDDFYFLEIINNTNLDYDLEILEEENKDNLIGHFIREMKEKDLENKTVKEALYLGLEALMRGKVNP